MHHLNGLATWHSQDIIKFLIFLTNRAEKSKNYTGVLLCPSLDYSEQVLVNVMPFLLWDTLYVLEPIFILVKKYHVCK